MKKVIFLLAIMGILFAANCNKSYATTYTFTPPNNGLQDLAHSRAYSWGLRHALQPGEIITGARIIFDDMNNWTVENNDIFYVRIFNTAPEGIRTFTDNQASGDYFADRGRRLFTWTDDNEYWNGTRWVNLAEDFTYSFTDLQLNWLTMAIQDGKFGFGFDPDCHFYNRGIKFEFDTKVVPEPASMSLLGLGLLGLLGFKKRKISKEKKI